MNKFEGLVTHQTVSNIDMEKIMSIPLEEIDKYSNVGVRIVETTNELYKIMARSMADIIINNNHKDIPTKIILPVGPTPQYEVLVQICNNEKIKLSRLWLFFMDEYLDWEGRLIPESHPMSFRGYMKKHLFELLNSNLGLSDSQIIWPDPADLDNNCNKIKELGGIDVCYGGIGYHGHIAFNEPFNSYYSRITIKDFLNSRTRVIDLNSDTFVVNSICGAGGNCYGIPPRAVTIGMKQIMESKRIELYCDGGDLKWQPATFRIACMHPPTLDRPGTLMQLHNDPKKTVLVTADRRTAEPVMGAPK
jgi:glucosamine-6-phosphate deaminase